LPPQKLNKASLSGSGTSKARLARIASLLAKFATGQSLLQILQAANGLAFVWFLSIQDFAVYAVFTGALGFTSQLAGAGISPSIVSLVGMGMGDGGKVGRYIAAGLRVRWALLAWILPLGAWLLWIASEKAQIPWQLFAALASCLAVCGYLSAQADLFGLPLKMVDRIGTIYRISIHAELIRLALVFSAWATGCLDALSAALISAAGLAYSLAALKKASRRHVAFPSVRPDRETSELLRIFLPTLPNAVFGAFQGQITIIVAAVFGGVSQIASIGALGRLGRLLGFLTAANPMLVGPALARMGEAAFWRRLPWILLLGLLAAAAIAATGFLFPEWLVWLLGANYAGLGTVVWLVTLTAGFVFFVQLLNTVVSYKRWVAWWASFGTIGMVLLLQALAVLEFDVSTLEGVLALGLAAAFARAVSLLAVAWVARFKGAWLIGPQKTPNAGC
jgi:O-antigen/teichoic acid export membrane protein